MDYLGRSEIIPLKTNSDPGEQVYFVDLDLSAENGPVQVCVVLTGLLDPEGAKSKVVAFTEVSLNP
jgi:hypothetical protein